MASAPSSTQVRERTGVGDPLIAAPPTSRPQDDVAPPRPRPVRQRTERSIELRDLPRRIPPRARIWLRQSLIVGVIAFVLACVLYRVWEADLSLPMAIGGDATAAAATVKGIAEHGWFLNNPSLGAPFGQQLYDFPMNGEALQFLAIKALTIVTPTAGWAMNLFFLLGFSFVAMVAHGVLRALRFSGAIAMSLGIAYAFLPFHYLHGIPHLTRSAYVTAPLVALLLVWAMDPPDALLRWVPGGSRWSPRPTKRFAVGLALCVVVGITETMVAAFAIVLLAIIAVGGAAARWSARRLLVPGAFAAVIAISFVVVSIPTFEYWSAHGHNKVAGARQSFDSQSYALRISAMLLPTPDHPVPAMGDLGAEVIGKGWLPSEGGQAIGLIGVTGFIGGVGAALVRRRRSDGPDRGRRDLVTKAGVAIIITTLVGITDGIGTILAVFGFQQVRAWNRIVVIIAFLCFVVVAAGLERVTHLLRARLGAARAAPTFAAIAFFLTSFAVWDAGSPVVADYGRIQSDLGSTEALVHQMEQTLPAGAMVFQYPVTVYPEAGPLHQMEDYDGFRPYLVSEHLRWSYGATKGRPTGDWQQKVPRLPVADALRGLAGYGFEGVLVDRFGYEPTALAAFERDLARVTAAAPVVSADGRYTFWDLRGYTQRLGSTPEQLAARAERLFGVSLTAPAGG